MAVQHDGGSKSLWRRGWRGSVAAVRLPCMQAHCGQHLEQPPCNAKVLALDACAKSRRDWTQLMPIENKLAPANAQAATAAAPTCRPLFVQRFQQEAGQALHPLGQAALLLGLHLLHKQHTKGGGWRNNTHW